MSSFTWWWRVEARAFFAKAMHAAGRATHRVGLALMEEGNRRLQRAVAEAKLLNAKNRAVVDEAERRL